MICVTYEMGFVRKAVDRVIIMDLGEIVEGAPPVGFFAVAQSERNRRFLSQVLGHGMGRSGITPEICIVGFSDRRRCGLDILPDYRW